GRSHVAGGGGPAGQRMAFAVVPAGVAQAAWRAQPRGEAPAAAGRQVQARGVGAVAVVVPGQPQQLAAQRLGLVRAAIDPEQEARAPRLVFRQLHYPALDGEVAALELRRKLPGEHPGRVQSERSEEHTSELQSRENLVCRLLLEKKNCRTMTRYTCRGC